MFLETLRRHTTMLTISIITPSYNQAEFLPATLRSVAEQDYPQIEHLVFDGGSTDGTLAVLEGYDPPLQWVSEPDNGQADAINKGLRQCSGDVMGWLNSDDLLLPGALRRVAEFFTRQPEVDVLYGDYQLIDEQGRVLLEKEEIPFDDGILRYGLDYISQPTTFWRRRVLERIGYLDESLHYGLDWEYWLRMADAGCQFGYLPQPLAATRWHTSAKTLVAPPKMYAEHQAIRDRYWRKTRLSQPRLQQGYAFALNKYYRLKRQWLKLRHGRKLDFPPADWVMASQMR